MTLVVFSKYQENNQSTNTNKRKMYGTALTLCFAGMMIGDFLLILVLGSIITKKIADWVNPANVHLDTCESSFQRKRSVKAYMKIVETNIERTMEHLKKIDGMTKQFDFDGSLKTFVTDYLQKTEIDINKKLDDSILFYVTLNVKDTVTEFSNQLCAELNTICFEKKDPVRFVYTMPSDENTGTFEMVLVKNATNRTDKNDGFVVMDTKFNILYHLVPHDEGYDSHIQYIMCFSPTTADGITTVESDIVDGTLESYTKIPFDASMHSYNGYNPDTASVISSVNEYFGPNKPLDQVSEKDKEDDKENEVGDEEENEDNAENEDEAEEEAGDDDEDNEEEDEVEDEDDNGYIKTVVLERVFKYITLDNLIRKLSADDEKAKKLRNSKREIEEFLIGFLEKVNEEFITINVAGTETTLVKSERTLSKKDGDKTITKTQKYIKQVQSKKHN
ncbi:hypothetical protein YASMINEVIRUS_976 [Yasminevirus sp. GU-2018]|uniref:Uncharacterized protein n=1 Tax=Yasminevirus sp. GU-2018 TaxID=2420051 RepID=A0A5K0UAN0_9VIRU|nr:hypothetical protein YASMINEVIRUS_976 [Yasminevirus sp. GU-2018]